MRIVGSVFKRAKGRRRRKASYYMKYRLPDGRWVRESTGTANFKAAGDKLREREEAIARGRFAAVGTARFSAVAEAWLRDWSKPRLRSHHDNELRYEKHLRPVFGAKALRNIRPADIKAFASAKIAKGLSVATVRRILALLSVILNDAVADDLLGESPFRRLKRGTVPPEKLGRLEFYDDDEVAKLLEAAPPNERPFLATGFYAGLRLGELCGLQWPDVNLKAGMMTVSRSWDNPIRLGRASTKSGSAREIPVAKALHPILVAWKANCPTTSSGLCFPVLLVRGADPTAPEPAYVMRNKRTVEKSARRLCESAGVRWLPVHCWRHTFAAAFVRRGGSLYHLQTVMGHSTPTLTMRYAHLVGKDTRPGMDRIRFAPRRSVVVGIAPARKKKTEAGRTAKASSDGAKFGAKRASGGTERPQ